MRIFIFYFLLLLIPSAYAYEGIFSILDERYVNSISELPVGQGIPDKTIVPNNSWATEHRETDYVWGWFDLLCCKNMTRIGNDFYVQDPANSTVVMYETHVHIYNRYYFQRWIYDLKKYESGGQLCAQFVATAVLYQIDQSGYVSYAYPSRTFQKCIPKPKQLLALKESQVIITQYNNSMYENVGIKILGDNYSKITFDYKDKHAERTFQILHVENNSGLTYGNVTEIDEWELSGSNISRFYDEILLDGNLSKMNLSEFDIRAYNPFTSVKANPANFTIRRQEFAPWKAFTGLFFGFIGVAGILFYSTIFLLRRLNTWHIRLF